MADERPFPARRILVGMDASASSLDALAAAAALAARLGSELAGLFVEDEDLLRLAGLPFGDLVRAPGGQSERLEPAAAEAALRALARQAREALERAAASHRVACSFRVARGSVSRELLAAAETADLVVLGAAGHGRPRRGAVGTTARAAAAGARASVLLLARGSPLHGEVIAVDDGGEGGDVAVAAARGLAPEGQPPRILPAGEDAGALVDAIAATAPRAPSLVVIPAAAATGGLVEGLLAAGIAVLVVR